MSEGKSYERRKSIKNWPAYNAGLKRRYDVTVYIDENVLEQTPQPTGRRGRPFTHGDALIRLCLTLRCLLRLPLRGTEGMVKGLFTLYGLPQEAVPEYTTLCRRGRNVKLPAMKRREGALIIAVDSTGLKVCGEGEWKMKMHGKSKRRRWRKLYIGVSVDGQNIVTSDLTDCGTGDQEHLPALLDRLPKGTAIKHVLADGIYDTYPCYDAVRKRGGTLKTPPRRNAVIRKQDPPHPRHKVIRDCRTRKKRTQWKIRSGYHRRALAETVMYRFKTAFTDRLQSREIPQQKTEAMIKVQLLNIFRKLAAPAY
jgi:IS5 family transposase